MRTINVPLFDFHRLPAPLMRMARLLLAPKVIWDVPVASNWTTVFEAVASARSWTP